MSQANRGVSRRNVLFGAAAGVAAAGLLSTQTALGQAAAAAAPQIEYPVAKNGKINHSVCLWCYKGMKLPDMIAACKKIGIKGIDLLGPKDFPLLKEAGLVCPMTSGVAGGIGKGYNRREHHEEINKSLTPLLEANAEYGFPNVICFSGNRAGQADDEGLKICAEGIKKVIGEFEKKNVNLVMELLNSKVNHKDYQCDFSRWGVDLCKAVGSERFKLLYDIYHMQIMEGDVIATIKKNGQYFAHYHTGGVPGRNEIDDTQELYYPAIMKAIAETGYKGYVAQEFIPKNKDMIGSLANAIRICDI